MFWNAAQIKYILFIASVVRKWINQASWMSLRHNRKQTLQELISIGFCICCDVLKCRFYFKCYQSCRNIQSTLFFCIGGSKFLTKYARKKTFPFHVKLCCFVAFLTHAEFTQKHLDEILTWKGTQLCCKSREKLDSGAIDSQFSPTFGFLKSKLIPHTQAHPGEHTLYSLYSLNFSSPLNWIENECKALYRKVSHILIPCHTSPGLF